ncbi:Dynein light chain [Macleaya cordata]|uniref:Dynein light chain n=1 Tax=Macleaya cordata TaxID=56857 RepID=A0A200R4X7_MACCD|nr:Dynein light chain [Macleaya cordata]
MLEGKGVVRETDMDEEMQCRVMELAYQALDLHEISDLKSIAQHIKQKFDEAYGPAWHCVVGADFGSCITHVCGNFIFFHVEMMEFLVFKDGNDLNKSKEEAIAVHLPIPGSAIPSPSFFPSSSSSSNTLYVNFRSDEIPSKSIHHQLPSSWLLQGHLESPSGEKKSGFLRWLSKLFKGSSSHQKINQRHPQLLGEEHVARRAPRGSMDDQSRAKNGELDHAIAVSLAEDSRKPNGFRRPTDHDEDLARELQERLNMPSYPSYDPTPFFTGGYRFCGGCNGYIGYGDYLACMGAFWHPGCFQCHACGQPITEHEFSFSGRNPYHVSCFRELHHPKCEVCRQFIRTNEAGLIEYRSHPFWGQKYCPSHEYDNTARCCSCERLESWNARYISLGDCRNLCLECLESAIMDTGDCQPLYHSIRDYYEGMNMKIDQQIPMLLVERQALNEAIEWEKNGHRHLPETRGLCLSEEQTVTSVHRRPRLGGNRLIGMKTHVQKLMRKCEVTAILVLFGLPRLLTGSILAHELMHGWLRLKGYRNLSPEVEEGICQVFSYMWLESEVLSGSRSMASTSSVSTSSSSFKKGGKSDAEKKLGEFFMHQISHDTSAYGKGFRAANAAINRYGLRRTLDHIRLTGNFPV